MRSRNRFEPPTTTLIATGSPSARLPESRTTIRAKRAAAVALACSYFLPLTSCNKHDYSAYTGNDVASVLGCASLVAFFWPIVFECAGWVFASFGVATWWRWPRFILVGCTVFVITYLIYWSEAVRYGALLAYFASGCYAVALWAALSGNRKNATG